MDEAMNRNYTPGLATVTALCGTASYRNLKMSAFKLSHVSLRPGTEGEELRNSGNTDIGAF